MFDRDRFDARLEDYLDGELSAEQARALEAFAAVDEESGHELRTAVALQERFRKMPRPACPPDVTNTVLAAARADARRSLVGRMKYFVAVRWATVLRPALVVGTFIGVVVTGTLVTREPAAPPTELASAEATPEEVEKALNEAKWALSFLSGVGRQTATTIRDGVLDEYVVKPVNRALSTAFDEDSRIQ